jgi:hypothetical protein
LRALAFLATATEAVHHRCITSTAFGGLPRDRGSTRNRMVKPNRPARRLVGRRIRLRGLLRENPAICRVFLFLGKRPRASPVHHDLRERALRDCPTRRNAVGQSAWLSQIPAPCLPMSACSERRLLNEQDDPAEPPPNQRDVRVELVARSGLFGRDATRCCNSCRCGRAVDSAPRFRTSSGAITLSGRRRAPALTHEAQAHQRICRAGDRGLAADR